MMPWTVDDPPSVAKNWTADEQRRCVSAANAVLRDDGTEQDAIFACIAAAGRSTKARGEGAGTGGPRQGDAGAETCVCPECGAEIAHERGTPCKETDCPKCGAAMVGEEDNVTEKATMKTESDGKHPASHYLVVEDPEKSSTWHLRVRGVDGDLDHRLMGGAWAALHEGYRGNVYEGPGKKGAIAKLRKLYSQEDMDVPSKKKEVSLDEQTRRIRDAWYVRFEPRAGIGVEISGRQSGWIKEVFSDRVIVEFAEGLFSYGYTLTGDGITFDEPVKVEVTYTAAEKGLLRQIADTVAKIAQVVFKKPALSAIDLSALARTGFTVTKDRKTGKRRWLGVPTSAFYPDREGEGLSTKALQGAVDRIMGGSEEVILDLAHVKLPKGKGIPMSVAFLPMEVGRADVVGMCGPFVVASGLETDGPYSKGFFDWIETNPDRDIRMSIEFEYDAAQKNSDGVYLDGVDIIRFTALPAEIAANPVTAFLVVDAKSIGGSAMKLDERVRPLLSDIYGEEVVTGIEGQLHEAGETALAAGAEVKSTDAEPEEPTEPDTETEAPEDDAPEVLTEAQLRDFITSIVAEELGAAQAETKALTGRLEAIETAQKAEAEAATARTRKFVFAPAEPVRKGGEAGSLSEAGIPMSSPFRK